MMANEKRLIDANGLSEELSSLTMYITGLRAGKGVLNEFMKEYRKSVLRIVNEQATVDAVEVVRCKECKQFKKWKNAFGAEGFKCLLLCADVEPENFCSFGERK